MGAPTAAIRRRRATIVDPLARTLEVLRLEGGRWVILMTAAGDDAIRAEPFESLEFALSQLWD